MIGVHDDHGDQGDEVIARGPGVPGELTERVTEPELMDEPAQARAYAEADFSEPNGHFVALFEEAFGELPPGASVLDLGCGPADIAMRIARRYPDCEVHAVDGAASMLALARDAVAAVGLDQRVKLVRACVPEDPLPRERYDAILSNSLLHHLHQPAGLWHTIARHAAPGAPVQVMDLFRPATEAAARALVEQHAQDAPPVLRRDFYASLLAAFRVGEVREQLARAGLAHLQARAISDRHLLVQGRAGR